MDDMTQRFLQHLEGQYAMIMLELGRQTGLLDALRAGPGTAEIIADRAGTHQRSTREWLTLLTAAGYLAHQDGVFRFQPGAEVLFGTENPPMDTSVLLRMGPLAGRVTPGLVRSMRDGGGVPYAEYQPDFTDMQDRINRAAYDRLLLAEWIPAAAGLTDRLAAGCHVADIGTGAGHALCLLATAYPTSTFVGYDLDTAALTVARERAAERGLNNVEFREHDLADGLDDAYDVVFALDTVHDLPDPGGLLRSARQVLRPGGALVLVEPAATGNVDTDIAQPGAVLRYFSSLFHCIQVSLAAGGPGLGNGWPTDAVVAALREAGFTTIDPAPTGTGQTVFQATATS